MKLSILICTLPERHDMFKLLLKHINRQLNGLEDFWKEVEVLHDANPSITTGAKRNKLINEAEGNFIVFIDDDDWVSDDYVYRIIKAIYSKPDADCIGMEGWITENGANKKDWKISKEFGSWYEKDNVYYRTPNHISPVKRNIAVRCGFPDKSFGEDYEYSQRILPHLKNEAYIPHQLYHYRFISNK